MEFEYLFDQKHCCIFSLSYSVHSNASQFGIYSDRLAISCCFQLVAREDWPVANEVVYYGLWEYNGGWEYVGMQGTKLGRRSGYSQLLGQVPD